MLRLASGGDLGDASGAKRFDAAGDAAAILPLPFADTLQLSFSPKPGQKWGALCLS